MRAHCGTAERGFTLLEVLVASGLILGAIAGVLGLLGSGTDTYATGVTKADVESHARNMVDMIAEGLVYSGNGVIFPTATAPLSSSTVTYQESTGFNGSTIQWGNPIAIVLVDSPSDPDDGRDNDHNGLVDEKMIVRRETTPAGTTSEVLLTRWVRKLLEGEAANGQDDNGNGLVDEPGLSLDRKGDLWTVRLTIERGDGKGNRLACTTETTVRPRN